MTTPNGEGPTELADMPHLSDVQATDALLDRLASRTPTADDLADPLIADLARFADFADANPVPAPGMDRLIEVLDGRPLYVFERGTAEVTEADRPIQLDDTRPMPSVIDLREPKPDGDDAAEDDGIAARATGTDGVVTASLLAQFRARREATAQTRTGWHGVVQQMALPAASVVALLALGGGVSAVVTGDPMAPVNGVTKVLTGGGSDSDQKLASADRDLDLAQQAAVHNEVNKANQYLASAKSKVDDLSNDKKQGITPKLNSVSQQVDAAVSAAAGAQPSVAPTPAGSSAPSDAPSPSTPAETVAPSDGPSVTPSDTPSATGSTASDAAAGTGLSTSGG